MLTRQVPRTERELNGSVNKLSTFLKHLPIIKTGCILENPVINHGIKGLITQRLFGDL